MADKITIFKEVFDYYYDGEITKEQLADLLLMHYETRWGNGVDIKEIKDKDLRKIWRILQYSVIKSTKNAKQYEKQQNKKSALQEVKETEFDLPKTDDNVENQNKADLSPSKPSVDAEYHQQVEMPSNGLKTGKEEVLEEDIINILNESNIMSNPTNIRLDKETGKYYTDEKIKEIREKVEKSNNKPLPVVEDNMPLWEDYLKDITPKLKDIINSFNSPISVNRTIQAPTNLRELLNSRAGRYYKDRIMKIIEHYTTQQAVA